jgi:hypothetical protein
MTLPRGLGVISIMAAPFLLSWLRLATSTPARFGAASPTQLCENVPYVIQPDAKPHVMPINSPLEDLLRHFMTQRLDICLAIRHHPLVCILS